MRGDVGLVALTIVHFGDQRWLPFSCVLPVWCTVLMKSFERVDCGSLGAWGFGGRGCAGGWGHDSAVGLLRSWHWLLTDTWPHRGCGRVGSETEIGDIPVDALLPEVWAQIIGRLPTNEAVKVLSRPKFAPLMKNPVFRDLLVEHMPWTLNEDGVAQIYSHASLAIALSSKVKDLAVPCTLTPEERVALSTAVANRTLQWL